MYDNCAVVPVYIKNVFTVELHSLWVFVSAVKGFVCVCDCVRSDRAAAEGF